MCARTSITKSLAEIRERFKPDAVQGELFLPRYNAAPTHENPVLYGAEGKAVLAAFRWGLIPSWAKESAIGAKMINARRETLKEKASYKNLLKDRRCLVVADGFYEWVTESDGRRHPVRVTLKSGDLFAIAGLWTAWKDPKGRTVNTYTVITDSSESCEPLKNLHDRMPVILDKSLERQWLDPGVSLDAVLAQNRALELDVYEVPKAVNSPRNEGPECIRRIDPEPPSLNLQLPL